MSEPAAPSKRLRIILPIVAAVLAWRITANGMTRLYSEDPGADTAASADKALTWHGGNPVALQALGTSLTDDDPEAAVRLLRESIGADPADGRTVLALARLESGEDNTEQTDRLVNIGTELMPTKADVREAAAAYWLDREQLDEAVRNWSAAMISNPSRETELFPVFLKIAEDPKLRPALTPVTKAPPPWWDRFFAFAARRAASVDTLSALYTMRRASDVPLTPEERLQYIARLRKDQRWAQAYIAWLSSLGRDERRSLGLLNHGDFEQEFSNAGFDWHLTPVDGIRVTRSHTYGVSGEKALHLVFQGMRVQYRHLYQPLYLAPGWYSLRGLVRADSLETRGGIQWTVSCAEGNQQRLAQSPRFLGTVEWQNFSTEFFVPGQDCGGQEIRLVSVGQRSLDYQIKGAIWFDDLSIRSLRERNLALIEEYKATLVGPPEPNPAPPNTAEQNPQPLPPRGEGLGIQTPSPP
jgi:hypothetical protein